MFIALGRFAYVTHCSLGVGGDVVWGLDAEVVIYVVFVETRPISSGSYLLGPAFPSSSSFPFPSSFSFSSSRVFRVVCCGSVIHLVIGVLRH